MNFDKDLILTHNQDLKARKQRLRWLLVLSSLPLFGVVAAFGIVPSTNNEPLPIQNVVSELTLPKFDVASISEDFWQEERIQRGDTIATLLARLNIEDSDAIKYLRFSKETRSLYQLVPGKSIEAQTNSNGELISLRYVVDGKLLRVDRSELTESGFKTSEQPLRLEQRVVMKSGAIRSSLFAATDDANIPDSIASQIPEILSTDIDFHKDLRKGDKFNVAYEVFYNKGEPVRYGRIVAIEFNNQGRTYQAIYFQDQQGRGGYYTPDGKNLKKAFLRSPLEFSRISSGFSHARFHPVLQRWRAHKGVDYAAPTGTRVRATADGVVALAGKQSGYGNVVILQHQNNYSTLYGHLSRFASGLRAGQKISQGDVIGYVGMTGLATGPHLHYEFKVNGQQHDPLKIAMPNSWPITPDLKPSFDRAARILTHRLTLMRGTNLAKLD